MDKKTDIGYVEEVVVDHDNNEVRVTVTTSPNVHHVEIPYENPGSGIIIVPEYGDIVVVEEINTSPVARASWSQANADFPASLSEGDVAIHLNDDTILHFNRQDDGSYDISIELNGDLTVNGEALATESHTHDYTWSDSGGSGTTDAPNDNGLT